MHIKLATYIVGVLEIVFSVLGIIVAIVNLLGLQYHSITPGTRILFIISIPLYVIYILLTIMLFYGISRNNALWIWIHLIATASLALSVFLDMILVIVQGVEWNLLYYIMFFIMLVFFVVIEYRCYAFIRSSVLVYN